MYINTLTLSDKTAVIFIIGAQSIAVHFSIFRIHTTSCSLVHLRPLTTLTGASRVQGPTIPAVPTFICWTMSKETGVISIFCTLSIAIYFLVFSGLIRTASRSRVRPIPWAARTSAGPGQEPTTPHVPCVIYWTLSDKTAVIFIFCTLSNAVFPSFFRRWICTAPCSSIRLRPLSTGAGTSRG